MVLAQQRQYREEYREQEVRSEVVVRRRRKVWKPQAMAVVSTLALFAVGIFIASQHADVAVTGYNIQRLKTEVAQMEASVAELRHQVEGLKSLQRIEEVATTRLHMERPARQVYIVQENLPAAPPRQEVSQTEGRNHEGKNPVVALLTRFFGQ